MNFIRKNIPYHLQVYEIIKEQILAGEFKSRERIYENKISQRLGISRSPIREALRMLEQDEFLVQTSSGLVVNPMDFQDIEEIYQCRMAVEPFAAKLAVEKIDEEGITKLQNFVNEAKRYYASKQYDKVIEANTSFHNLLIQSCGNSRLQKIIEKISSLTILSRITEIQHFHREEDYLDDHQAIIDALKNKDGDLIETTLREHIVADFHFYKKKYREKNAMTPKED